MSLTDTIQLIRDIVTLLTAAIEAVNSGDTTKLKDIIPDEMRTTLAKAAADERARKKFEDA